MAQKPKPAEGRKPRIMIYDIETTNLSANFGYAICASVKEVGVKKIRTYTNYDYPAFDRDPTNDKFVIKDLIKDINQADIVVTWYGRKFDEKYIRTRAMLHGTDVPAYTSHVDLWRIARFKMRLTSNSMKSVSEFFDLDVKKTPLNGRIWTRGAAGHEPSIRKIVKHCEADVLVTEALYMKMRPAMDAQHPNIALLSGKHGSCTVCGGSLWNKGYYYARTMRYRKYKCRSCGVWSRNSAGEKVKGADTK